MRKPSLLVLLIVLAACSEPAPVSKPVAERENPLQGTVLQDQGEAIKRAREVEDAIQQADQKRREELDAME